MAPGYCLDRVLQLGQREFLWHQLENDRSIFELCTQPCDGRCQYAPVIEAHGLSQCRKRGPGERRLAAITSRLFHQSGIVEELIAVEHLFLIPWAVVGPEAEPKPLAAPKRATRLWAIRAASPFAQKRHDHLVENVRPLLAPILPREEPVPGLEAGSGRP